MEITGLPGEKVRLVPVDRSQHFDNALRWMNDLEVTRYLNMTTGVTPGMEEEWFQKVQKRDTDLPASRRIRSACREYGQSAGAREG
jgi:hypothetical protein